MMRRNSIAASLSIAILFLFAPAAFAGGKSAAAKPAATVVDQGSFGVFQSGRRVATETFTIRQYPDSSTTTSEFHAEAGQTSAKIEQSSELTLYPNGSLFHYEWKQISPSKSSATVQPGEQVLNLHTVSDGKTTDQPFFLGLETFILDDYFFSTREVLLWRYLASAECKPRPAGDGCDLLRQRVPILIPHRRISAQVFVEFKGYEDLPLNGRPQHLRHFLLQTDGPEWHLWLDADHKLVRISIPDTSTEILRLEAK